jgi:cytidine deaminase
MNGLPAIKEVTDAQIRALHAAATDGRERGRRPYSNYPVAAAVLTVDDRIYGGPGNIECANYTLSKHAEETAVIAAMTDGAMTRVGRRFIRAIYLPTVAGRKAAVCGGCRQFVWEFSDSQTAVIVEIPEGGTQTTLLSELLPEPFGPDDLGIKDGDSPP